MAHSAAVSSQNFERLKSITAEVSNRRPREIKDGICKISRVDARGAGSRILAEYTPYYSQRETPIISTTMWLTRPDNEGGFYDRLGKECVRRGLTLHVLGAPLSVTSHPGLGTTAALMLNLNKGQEELGLVGHSRGGMSGCAVMSIAPHFGVTIKRAELLAPCFADKGNMQGAIGIAGQVINDEVQSVGKVSAMESSHHGISFGRGLHKFGKMAVRSLMTSPSELVSAGQQFVHFWGGPTGKFIPGIPKEQDGHIQFFSGDSASQPHRFIEYFADHSNISIGVHRGLGHLGLFSSEFNHAALDRLQEAIS
jgi:hypothetical protein